MNKNDEYAFAQALFEHAARWLETAQLANLRQHIAADDERKTVARLLQTLAAHDIALPPMLSPFLWCWMSGFAADESEKIRRELSLGIRLSHHARPLRGMQPSGSAAGGPNAYSTDSAGPQLAEKPTVVRYAIGRNRL